MIEYSCMDETTFIEEVRVFINVKIKIIQLFERVKFMEKFIDIINHFRIIDR